MKLMIQANRINIIALDNSYSEQILLWANDPTLKRLTGTVFPISRDEHETWLHSKSLEKTDKLYCIYHKLDKKIIGIIGNKSTDLINRNTEIYLYLGDNEYRGNGYGKEAVNCFCDFLYNCLNLHKINLRVFEYNNQAINCYKGCGFRVEGKIKDNIFNEGRYWDVIFMGKVKNSVKV